MPAKYSIKRNSLSSRWGVWVTDTDAESPVEKLLAELKSNEDADAYCTRIQAGEAHDAIIESLSSKKKKKADGGGMFGKLFKRGSAQEHNEVEERAMNNPVIEIEATRKAEAAEEPAAQEAPPTPQPVAEAPSRFQAVEPPPAPPAPAPAPAPAMTQPQVPQVSQPVTTEAGPAMAEVEQQTPAAPATQEEVTAQEVPPPAAEAETRQHAVPAQEQPAVSEMPASPEPATQPEAPTIIETQPVERPVTQEPVAQQAPQPEPPAPAAESQPTVQASVPPTAPQPQPQAEHPSPQQPPAHAPAPQQETGRDDGLIVDWTFTPPPDVTPAELRASGDETAQQASPAAANEAVAPEPQPSSIQPQTSTTQPVNSTPEATPDEAAGAERMTVEVCVPTSVKENSSGDPDISDKKYNSIASKEYTEVSKAFATKGSQDTLKEELTHLAAVCLAWADAIEKRQTSNQGTRAA